MTGYPDTAGRCTPLFEANMMDVAAISVPSQCESDLSTDTVDLDALLADARAQAAAGNTEAALDTVRACVERGLDVEGWIKAGQVADDCGDLDLAESCWRALETLEPWEPEWLLRQADVAVERTEYDHACRLVATAKERWPNHPMVQSHSLRYSGLYGRSNSNMFDAEEIAADATTRPPAALDAARWLVGAGMTEPAGLTDICSQRKVRPSSKPADSKKFPSVRN